MSTHIDFELDSVATTLEQKFTLLKDVTIFHVAIKLNIFNDPAGTFTLKIKDGVTEIASSSLTVAQMNTEITAQGLTSHPYKLGFVLFTFDPLVNLKREVEYTLELSSSGYTYSAISSIGWVKEYSDETNVLIDTALNDTYKAFSYRLWGYINA